MEGVSGLHGQLRVAQMDKGCMNRQGLLKTARALP